MNCYKVADNFYQCITHNKLGKLNEMPEENKIYFKNFTNCLFKEN